MNITVYPGRLQGAVRPPASKSQMHRALLCAALASGESRLLGVTESEDLAATEGCIQVLGAVCRREGSRRTIIGRLGGARAEALPRFDCGESASTLRFVLPLALALFGGGSFTGAGRLMERPMEPYRVALEGKGICWQREDSVLTVRGELPPGTYCMPGDVSSQFFSGLLLALPLLKEDSLLCCTTPLQSRDYAAMTRRMQEQFGVRSEALHDGWRISGRQVYRPTELSARGDWSAAAFWYTANFLGSAISVEGMFPLSAQSDRLILPCLELLGGPQESCGLDLTHCPDLAPPLAAAGALRPGVTVLRHVSRLRWKESNRLEAITRLITALGGEVKQEEDRLLLYGKKALPGGVTVDCAGDHRIAMMAAVLATRCREAVTLLGADCVKKSYPAFWRDYAALGGRWEEQP